MIIPLSDEYELESNDQCYWINRYVITKKGDNAGKRYKRGDAYCGYHKRISDLMENFLQYRIRELDVTELNALATRIEQIGAEVKALCLEIEKQLAHDKNLEDLLS